MKLLYLWIKNYNDFILGQEFSFSSEYKVSFDGLKKITIAKNEKYIESFYGKNILEITTIVGENGAGKTTLARMIHSKCNSVQPFGDITQKYNQSKNDFDNDYSKQIQVYVNKYIENGEEKEEIIIFYFLGKGIILEVNANNFSYLNCINLDELKNNENGKMNFSMAEEKHKITVIYFTNAFDINHIAKEYGLTESKNGRIDKSIAYSPAYNFKKAKSENNDLYGSNKIDSLLVHGIISEYAAKMNLDYFEAYKKYQAYDFLIAFKNAPKNIKKQLPFFQEFCVSIKMFANYVEYDEKIVNTDYNFDNIMYFIKSNIADNLYKNIQCKSLIKSVFINVICETILFLNVWDQSDDFEILFENNIFLMSDKGAFELVLNNIMSRNPSKAEAINLIKKATLIKLLDISILKEFQELITRKEEYNSLLESNWYIQFSDYIDKFEENKALQLLNKISFENVEIIDFLFKEFKKTSSLYKRMLNIEPIEASTGEGALVNIFASLYRTIELKETSENIILIIDELDAYLHPRWQQKILKNIIEWINDSIKDKKIQLIITSHSPIVLSDMTVDRVIKLKKNENNHCVICNSTQNTFGANISTLFYDSFFMDQGSIGEIAKEKITNVLNYINRQESKVSSYEEAEYIINNIGEPIVKQKLLSDIKLKAIKEQNSSLEQITKMINKLSKEELNKVKELIKRNGDEIID